MTHISFDYTTRALRKHGVVKVCRFAHLTTEIELVLPIFKFWTIHKIIEHLTSGLLSSLRNVYHSTTAYFLTHIQSLFATNADRKSKERKMKQMQNH